MKNLLNKYLKGYTTVYSSNESLFKIVKVTDKTLTICRCDIDGEILNGKLLKVRRSPFNSEEFVGIGKAHRLTGLELIA